MIQVWVLNHDVNEVNTGHHKNIPDCPCLTPVNTDGLNFSGAG
jgi:hypothetical protein